MCVYDGPWNCLVWHYIKILYITVVWGNTLVAAS